MILIASAAGLATPAIATASFSSRQGSWLNPHGSVAVRTGPCGDELCGWICKSQVWTRIARLRQ